MDIRLHPPGKYSTVSRLRHRSFHFTPNTLPKRFPIGTPRGASIPLWASYDVTVRNCHEPGRLSADGPAKTLAGGMYTDERAKSIGSKPNLKVIAVYVLTILCRRP